MPAADRHHTVVELVWVEKEVEQWLRFGHPAAERTLDRRRRWVAFAPGQVFALVRWRAHGVAAAASRLDILRTVAPGEACSTVPGVTPGGEPLLRISGRRRVRLALAAIDAVEGLGLDPVDVAPDHWRHLHNRLLSRTPARPYSLARHRAWRLRRALDA